MSWTTKQISDLDNSMVAAQNVSLGTFLDAQLNGKRIASSSGSVTPNNARYPVTTGLTTVTAAFACLAGAPAVLPQVVTATAGSVAGTIIISTYHATAADNVALTSASADYIPVNWIALGVA